MPARSEEGTDPLELELKAVVSHPVVLGIEPWCYGRAASAFDH